MAEPTAAQCEAIAAAADEARKADYWSTADPYLIGLVCLVMLAILASGYWLAEREGPRG